MQSRRRFLAVSASSLTLLGTRQVLFPAGSVAEELPPAATPTSAPDARALVTEATIWVPLSLGPEPPDNSTNEPIPDPTSGYDAPLLGPASGSLNSAYQWLVSRPNRPYVAYDIEVIVKTYQRLGDEAGIDWFLALAQLCHETDHLRSWWCQRPRRNPAGIGVTGASISGTPDAPPNNDFQRWAYRDGVWWEGVSFNEWDDDAVAAHLGRLLAYAVQAPETELQGRMIDYAIAIRGMPASLRGIAPTILGLNGRWAYPGTEYGQRILALRDQMQLF